MVGVGDRKLKPVIDKRSGTRSKGHASNKTRRRRWGVLRANMRAIIGVDGEYGQDIGNSLWSG